MHEWLSGGVSPCQGEGRGFESRLVLFCVLTDKERMDCQWLPDDMQVLLAFFIIGKSFGFLPFPSASLLFCSVF